MIQGTRMSVEFILGLLASGVSQEEILNDYPHLKKDDLGAVLLYASRSLRNEVYIPFKKSA